MHYMLYQLQCCNVDGCSSSFPMEMRGFLGGMAVTFIVLGEGLPIPGIDFFEDFLLLTLAVANLELEKKRGTELTS